MKNKIYSFLKKFLMHELISGSLYIFAGSILGSIFSFLFNLFMSRNLLVSDYGTLASITSLITLPSLLASAILPGVINFAAMHIASGEHDKARTIYLYVTKITVILGIIFLLLLILFSQQIGVFFKINQYQLIFIAGIAVFVNFVAIANSAFLQANISFTFLSFSNLIGALFKLFIGVLLVLFGFGVQGALIGLTISFIIPYVLAFLPLRFLFAKNISAIKLDLKAFLRYGGLSALCILSLTSFTTSDIILVKHLLNASDAGMYAGLSLIGRVIFYLTAPISTVMFPLIVQKYTKNENFNNIFKLAVVLVFIPSMCLVVFYFFFPDFTIKFFLKKSEYLAVSSYLGLFGIYMTVYSLLYVFVNFFLSIKKTKIFIPVTIGAILQLFFISIYHSNFIEIISISLVISSILLLLFIIYYLKLFTHLFNSLHL